ncbi:UNVERIFIED_CONTAM: hypothetical protein K2H54_043294 [Gekko kuhli]
MLNCEGYIPTPYNTDLSLASRKETRAMCRCKCQSDKDRLRRRIFPSHKEGNTPFSDDAWEPEFAKLESFQVTENQMALQSHWLFATVTQTQPSLAAPPGMFQTTACLTF